MPGFISPAVQRHATIFEDLAKQTDRGVPDMGAGVARDEVLLEYKTEPLEVRFTMVSDEVNHSSFRSNPEPRPK
jgi:hypothetical protein